MQYHIIEPDEVNDLTETIVFFHGGPTVQTTCKWDRVIASFLSENFRVIAPNPRGGIGRGADYCSLDDGKRRLNLMNDEIGPFIEKINLEFGNICVYGGSYGGWIVLTLATSLTWGKYLKAAASRNGIACMETFFDKTGPWRVKHREREYLGEIDKTEKAQLTKKLSPIESESLECNNLLLICGRKDPRVPIETSEKFAKKFNLDLHNPEEFLRFDDEGHKIKRFTNRKELIEKTIKLFRNVSN
jgi:dipeptidyl aminopeptidase/acylaminoacyl peptidase